MTPQAFLSLALQTIMAPRDVARLLLSLNLGKDAVLTAFALVVALNAFVFQLTLIVSPTPGVAGILAMPVAFAGIQAIVLGATIAAITWCGQAMGGTATMTQVAVLLTWLQALRVAVQAGLLLILPLSNYLAGMVMFVASALGLWILVHFIDEAHGFGRIGKAALVLLLAVTGMVLGLSMILSLSGATVTGMN
ncbi:YIP1 family protein [Cognatishimia sp. F0-27]|uniref:YIP1 family protein n=1 Tax=Cognatishimia sp. F0-27 TaxID=2816855 RepID=UPI001D0C6829|nr:YIP1 family protein [Cognatishimia sp. F0-27]MCC1491651.1 YIP1 family protein [Cognatishimia sp. F0-27]